MGKARSVAELRISGNYDKSKMSNKLRCTKETGKQRNQGPGLENRLLDPLEPWGISRQAEWDVQMQASGTLGKKNDRGDWNKFLQWEKEPIQSGISLLPIGEITYKYLIMINLGN